MNPRTRLRRCRPALAFALALLVAGCGPEPLQAPDEALVIPTYKPIIGGIQANEAFLYGVGALVINSPMAYQPFCTGTLISGTLVLTAAHCLGEIPKGAPLGFFIGANAKSPLSGTIVPISQYWIHPSYKGGTPPGTLADYYDIAVVKLSKSAGKPPLKMIRPAEVGPMLSYGRELLIMGYGRTNATNTNSAGIKYYGYTSLGAVGNSEIWLNGSKGPRKCKGDSGGPTLVDVDPTSGRQWRLVGVASRGAEGCTTGTIETRVDKFLSWIHQKGAIPCGSGLSKDCPTTPPVLKKLGQACTKSEDCQSKLCVVSGGAMVCSQYCTLQPDNCPGGYVCTAISGTNKGACVKGEKPKDPEPDAGPPVDPPTKKGFGEGCTGHGDCQSGLCASMDGKRFCSRFCVEDDECGDSMVCTPAGGDQKACAPGSKAEDPTGSEASSGGCAVTAGEATPALPGILLISLLALIALRPRRR